MNFQKNNVIKRNYPTNLCLAPPALVDEGRKIVGIPRHRINAFQKFPGFAEPNNKNTGGPKLGK